MNTTKVLLVSEEESATADATPCWCWMILKSLHDGWVQTVLFSRYFALRRQGCELQAHSDTHVL